MQEITDRAIDDFYGTYERPCRGCHCVRASWPYEDEELDVWEENEDE